TSDIDSAAQSFASERRQQAAIRAFCIDANEVHDEAELLEFGNKMGAGGSTILVLTKADSLTNAELSFKRSDAPPALLTSSRTGQGLDLLCLALCQSIGDNESVARGQVIAATATRCRDSVRLAESSLKRAAELVISSQGHELVAVELRAALEELGTVVGALYT